MSADAKANPKVTGMDLLLWRHAEAEAHPDLVGGLAGDSLDLARALSPRGIKQAQRMGRWLDSQLPQGAPVYCSPALRAEQTVLCLGRRVKLRDALLPDADADALLALVKWPQGRSPALVVGHQPVIGQVISRLFGLKAEQCSVKKGAVWWLRHRERDGVASTVVVAVQNPDLV